MPTAKTIVVGSPGATENAGEERDASTTAKSPPCKTTPAPKRKRGRPVGSKKKIGVRGGLALSTRASLRVAMAPDADDSKGAYTAKASSPGAKVTASPEGERQPKRGRRTISKEGKDTTNGTTLSAGLKAEAPTDSERQRREEKGCPEEVEMSPAYAEAKEIIPTEIEEQPGQKESTASAAQSLAALATAPNEYGATCAQPQEQETTKETSLAAETEKDAPPTSTDEKGVAEEDMPPLSAAAGASSLGPASKDTARSPNHPKNTTDQEPVRETRNYHTYAVRIPRGDGEGFGFSVIQDGGRFLIHSLTPGRPASRLGSAIQIGDAIVRVHGVDTTGLSLPGLIAAIKATLPGKPLLLHLSRASSKRGRPPDPPELSAVAAFAVAAAEEKAQGPVPIIVPLPSLVKPYAAAVTKDGAPVDPPRGIDPGKYPTLMEHRVPLGRKSNKTRAIIMREILDLQSELSIPHEVKLKNNTKSRVVVVPKIFRFDKIRKRAGSKDFHLFVDQILSGLTLLRGEKDQAAQFLCHYLSRRYPAQYLSQVPAAQALHDKETFIAKKAAERLAKIGRLPDDFEMYDGGNKCDDEAVIWNLRYRELLQYKETHGDCLVPHRKDKSELGRLGNFVQSQREKFKAKTPSLTPRRIELLNEIGFVWRVREEVDARYGSWMKLAIVARRWKPALSPRQALRAGGFDEESASLVKVKDSLLSRERSLEKEKGVKHRDEILRLVEFLKGDSPEGRAKSSEEDRVRSVFCDTASLLFEFLKDPVKDDKPYIYTEKQKAQRANYSSKKSLVKRNRPLTAAKVESPSRERGVAAIRAASAAHPPRKRSRPLPTSASSRAQKIEWHRRQLQELGAAEISQQENEREEDESDEQNEQHEEEASGGSAREAATTLYDKGGGFHQQSSASMSTMYQQHLTHAPAHDVMPPATLYWQGGSSYM